MHGVYFVSMEFLIGRRFAKYRIPGNHLLLILIIMTLYPIIAVADDDYARSRFKTEAQAGWARMEESMTAIVGSLVGTSESYDPKDSKTLKGNDKTKIWIAHGATKVQVEMYDNSGKSFQRTVFCINPDYAFALKQDIQDGPYQLEACGQDLPVIDQIQRGINAMGLWRLRIPYSIESDIRPLPDIVKSKNYQLIRCTEKQDGDRKLIEVEFNFKQDESIHSGMFASNGQDRSLRVTKVLLDPEADWRVVRSATKRAGGESKMEVTYHQEHSGSGNVASAQISIVQPKDISTTKLDYSPLLHQDTALEDFYLPAFGLPHCSKPANWRPLLIIINILVVGIFLIVIYRRRRAKAAT
jgi:hypothetical protein